MLRGMRKNMGIALAWLAATVLSVVIASAAVAGIRDRVVETPVAIGAPTTASTDAPPETTTASNDSGPATTTTVLASTVAPTTTNQPVTTTTTVVESPPATSAPPQTTTTTTTTQPPETTTTAAASFSTYKLVGGTVILSVGNGEVWVVAADPNAGFDADIEKGGPVEVEVDFESNTHKSELSAKIENGELKVETEEEPRDGDDD